MDSWRLTAPWARRDRKVLGHGRGAIEKSRVGGEEGFVRYPSGQPLDIEGLVQARAELRGVNEKADLGGLARKKPAEIWVEPTHQGTLCPGAARRTVADVADLVGQDLAVETFDSCGHGGFVGEYLNSNAA